MTATAVSIPATTRRQQATAFWAAFAAPGVGWLIAFFVVSVYAVMAVAFGAVDPILRTAQPQWNPLSWNFDAMSRMLDRVLYGDLRQVFVRTGTYIGLALVGCALIGYPVAYFAARVVKRRRGLLMAALVLPFWISYLMRMLAWTNLLQPDGYVNKVLRFFHLMDEPRNWLNGDPYTVIIGLIYGYVPFFILPLFSSLERLDGRLIEAGRDLGASAFQTFRRVTLPLSVPGLLAASVITVLPMAGDYYTNTYLTSGSPKTTMVGNQIEFFLQRTSQPQSGASLVLLLMACLFLLMLYYLVITIRLQRAAER